MWLTSTEPDTHQYLKWFWPWCFSATISTNDHGWPGAGFITWPCFAASCQWTFVSKSIILIGVNSLNRCTTFASEHYLYCHSFQYTTMPFLWKLDWETAPSIHNSVPRDDCVHFLMIMPAITHQIIIIWQKSIITAIYLPHWGYWANICWLSLDRRISKPDMMD